MLCDQIEKLGTSVSCQKIDSMRNRSSSFHVTADVTKLMKRSATLAGRDLCTSLFEARRPKVNSGNGALASGGEADPQQQRSVTVFTPVAPQGCNSQAAARDE